MKVRDSLLRLALMIDPKDKNGVTFSSATIGVSDGDKFPKQKLLDMYNDARYSLFEAFVVKFHGDVEALASEINASLIDAIIVFVSGISLKPSGFIKPILLTDSNTPPVQINFLSSDYMEAVRTGNLPSFVETATKRFVFEIGSQIIHLAGPTNFADGNYKLTYIGLPLYTLTDVTGGVVIESYNDQFNPMILELAQAIASEQGYKKVNAMAQKLLGVA